MLRRTDGLTGSLRLCSTMAAEEMPMKNKALAALAATIFALTVSVKADDYPSRSMAMIIPFAAGGPTDVLGRMVAGRMSEILHQNVIVENINGAGGQTGSLRVANPAAPGHQFVRAPAGAHPQGPLLDPD